MMKKITLLLIFACCILTGCINAGDEHMDITESSSIIFTKGGDVNALHAEIESTNVSELPTIVFLVRTDISEVLSEMSDDEVAQQNIVAKSLGFYDKNGDYYISFDPELNALDNKTLIAEYEAGHLTEQIEYYTSCNVNVLTEQYAKLRKIYQTGQIEIVYPNELPTVQAESSTWFGFYFGQDGDVQYQAIHEKERMVNLYANNDVVNEVYDWIVESFKDAEQLE